MATPTDFNIKGLSTNNIKIYILDLSTDNKTLDDFMSYINTTTKNSNIVYSNSLIIVTEYIIVDKNKVPNISLILTDNQGKGILLCSSSSNNIINNIDNIQKLIDICNSGVDNINELVQTIVQTELNDNYSNLKEQLKNEIIDELHQYIPNEPSEEDPTIDASVLNRIRNLESNTTELNNLVNSHIEEIGNSYNGYLSGVQHKDHTVSVDDFKNVIQTNYNNNTHSIDKRLVNTFNIMLNRLYENNYVNETRTTHVQENRYNDNLNNQDSIEYLGGYNNIMYKINQKIEKLETNIKLTEDKLKLFTKYSSIFYKSTVKLSETTSDKTAGIHINAFGDANIIAHEYKNGEGTILFDKQIKIIDDFAFYGCTMTELILPDSVEEIGYAALGNTNLRSVIIPENVNKLGNYSLYISNSNYTVTLKCKTIPTFRETENNGRTSVYTNNRVVNTLAIIKVPSSKISEYKSKNIWNKFSNQFTSI